MAKKFISFENVGFRYYSGPEVLKDISLSLPKGGFFFVTGLSGVGKTTLLKLMYTALKPTRGLIRLFNIELATLATDQFPILRRRIGGIFDDLPLIEQMTVFENVALPLVIQNTSENQISEEVKEMLDWVHLKDYLDYYPSMLSSGQKQRVAIARAVVSKPSLFLADEPTANVDEKLAQRLLFLIHKLNETGTTVVMATHNQVLLSSIKKARILHIKDANITLYNNYHLLPKDYLI